MIQRVVLLACMLVVASIQLASAGVPWTKNSASLQAVLDKCKSDTPASMNTGYYYVWRHKALFDKIGYTNHADFTHRYNAEFVNAVRAANAGRGGNPVGAADQSIQQTREQLQAVNEQMTALERAHKYILQPNEPATKRLKETYVIERPRWEALRQQSLGLLAKLSQQITDKKALETELATEFKTDYIKFVKGVACHFNKANEPKPITCMDTCFAQQYRLMVGQNPRLTRICDANPDDFAWLNSGYSEFFQQVDWTQVNLLTLFQNCGFTCEECVFEAGAYGANTKCNVVSKGNANDEDA